MTVVAAVDLGTTTARAGVFDASGRRVGVARRRIPTAHPFPGAVEQDPVDLATTVVELLRTVIADAGIDAAEVAGLGIANQRATVVAWSAGTGEPFGPAIGWQDTRTAPRVAALVAQGIPLTTSASCSKLEWLVSEHDAVRSAAAGDDLRLGTVDSWLTWALSADRVHVTDPSNAGATGLYDLRVGDWSPGALELFGVPPDALATVVASDEVVGHTRGELLGAEIPLAARIGDQQAACVAHRMARGGAKLTLGTSAMLDVGTGADPGDAPPGTYALPLCRRCNDGPERDEFLVEGSVQTAGAVVEWLVAMGLLPAVEELDASAGLGRPGAVLVPALAGLGSPRQDPSARGILGGLGLDTRPPDVVRAAVAGIADRVADLVDTLGVTGALLVDGGLSRSDVMLRELADVTGLTMSPADDPETTLRGAAMLAAAAGGSRVDAVTYGRDVVAVMGADERAHRRAGWRRWVDAASGHDVEGRAVENGAEEST